MRTLLILIKRNVKLFFKDKGMFFASLITPIILLLLYSTFLGNVYRDSFVSSLPEGFILPEKLIKGLVGGELISSMLAVSCVTVAFCSNFLMVQDKVNGAIKDLTISPVKPAVLSVAYYFANLASTLLVCYVAMGLCFIYLAIVGWYMTVADVFLVMLDVFIISLFGNALSSVINFFLNSQGQISAVGTLVSSVYGFICGAYMPISSFSDGLQKVISLLPGTYGTSIIRNHSMQGAFNEMLELGVPVEVMDGVKASLDCKLSFFGHNVPISIMYVILVVSILVLLTAYILLNIFAGKRNGVAPKLKINKKSN